MEAQSDMVTSRLDPKLLQDDRLLESLLDIEEHFIPHLPYFKIVQNEVEPFMRRMLTHWMLEVCEKRCEEGVLALAVNYLDRFLALVSTRKADLQLLGAVCLFLASKLKEARPLSAAELCGYTDDAIATQELLQWELVVVEKLKWDLAAIVPHDFIEPLVTRLRLPAQELPQVRQHVQALLGLCVTDFSFAMYPPSMIASASVGVAVRDLRLRGSDQAPPADELLPLLAVLIHTETDCLSACQEQMEGLVAGCPQEGRQLPHTKGPDPQDLSCTPTDVQDVHL
ncbi:hypothetical protein COCON_G00228750 [Conger conger]|uniref:Cyclin D2 n=1 Tax=Conger conger TaxID=82655 RepID=A0A9Q1CUU1_CONCO|nr:hypothetical protein COCON_G00228750 [Conger conger]